MKKEFSLQSFKSSASNASDFLKTKGYDIPRSLMLNTLSVFMGMKNWNTAQAMLSNEIVNKKENTLDEIIKSKNGLVLISSNDPQKIIDYIKNIISIKLMKEVNNGKVLRSEVFEYNFLRREPDYIIIDLLKNNKDLIFAMNAASTGHLVFLGVDLKDKNNAKEKLFEMLIKKDNVKLNDVLNLNDVIKEIIHLD